VLRALSSAAAAAAAVTAAQASATAIMTGLVPAIHGFPDNDKGQPSSDDDLHHRALGRIANR
jgi:hypothetical protein